MLFCTCTPPTLCLACRESRKDKISADIASLWVASKSFEVQHVSMHSKWKHCHVLVKQSEGDCLVIEGDQKGTASKTSQAMTCPYRPGPSCGKVAAGLGSWAPELQSASKQFIILPIIVLHFFFLIMMSSSKGPTCQLQQYSIHQLEYTCFSKLASLLHNAECITFRLQQLQFNLSKTDQIIGYLASNCLDTVIPFNFFKYEWSQQKVLPYSGILHQLKKCFGLKFRAEKKKVI